VQANNAPLRLTVPLQPSAEPTEVRTKAVSDAVAVVPLTYSRQQLAEALGIDVATLDRWDAAGRIGPRPLRISGPRGRKLYGRAEVEDWLRAGAPTAEEWKARQAARRK